MAPLVGHGFPLAPTRPTPKRSLRRWAGAAACLLAFWLVDLVRCARARLALMRHWAHMPALRYRRPRREKAAKALSGIVGVGALDADQHKSLASAPPRCASTQQRIAQSAVLPGALAHHSCSHAC